MKYKDTKLIQFLCTFSKEELNNFEKYLNSPYFKKGRDPLPLFKVLTDDLSKLTADELNEENVFGKIYPGSSYKDKNSHALFRNASSSLLKAVEDFIYISKLKEDKVLRSRIILSEIIERNLTRHYPQYLKPAYEALEEYEIKSGSNELEIYHLERLNSRFYSVMLDMEKYFVHGAKAFEHLSFHFFTELINSAKADFYGMDNLMIKNSERIPEQILNSINLEKIINIFREKDYYTQLYFCFNMYLFHRENKKEFYVNAYDIFFKNKNKICRADRCAFYADLMSIHFTGNSPNVKEEKLKLFELIKSCLDDNAFKISDEDFMHPNFYRNALLCADYLKEFDWAEKFISHYTAELKPEFRQNMKHYSLALINYGKGKYEESLDYIGKVKYEMVFFKTDVKILMLRLFYELKLYDQAHSMVDALKHHTRISEIMDADKRESFMKYLNYYLKLLKISSLESRISKKEAGILKKELSQDKKVYQNLWLIEKLDEMIK